MNEWFLPGWTAVLGVVLSTLGIYAAIIVATRLYGLRSYSKMSSFDFAITVAIGTVVATTLLLRDPPLLQGIVALGSIFLLRWLVAVARERSKRISSLLDNKPILLMRDGQPLWDSLRRVHMTEGELREIIRERGILRLSEVRAVVLERAGDASVLTGNSAIDHWLMADVEGWSDHVDHPSGEG